MGKVVISLLSLLGLMLIVKSGYTNEYNQSIKHIDK